MYAPTDVSPCERRVWEHNNLAQKNLISVDLVANDAVVIPFRLGSLNLLKYEIYRLEIRRPGKWREIPIAIVHKDSEVIRQLFRSVELMKPTVTTPSVQPGPVLRFLEQSRVEIIRPGLTANPIRLNLGRNSTLDLDPEAVEPEVVDAAFSETPWEADLVTDQMGVAGIAFRQGC